MGKVKCVGIFLITFYQSLPTAVFCPQSFPAGCYCCFVCNFCSCNFAVVVFVCPFLWVIGDFGVLYEYMEEDNPVVGADGSDGGVGRAIGLALLEKSADEYIRLSDEVEKILVFVSEVQSIEVDDAVQGEAMVNVFRDDVVVVEPGVYREKMLAQAPMSFKRWFLSKKIL